MANAPEGIQMPPSRGAARWCPKLESGGVFEFGFSSHWVLRAPYRLRRTRDLCRLKFCPTRGRSRGLRAWFASGQPNINKWQETHPASAHGCVNQSGQQWHDQVRVQGSNLKTSRGLIWVFVRLLPAAPEKPRANWSGNRLAQR